MTSAAITELVDRVRERAPSPDSGGLRAAFAAELEKVSQAFTDNPRAEAWSAWANCLDIPGHAYESLLDGAQRREAGQFQTPTWAADLMARWLLLKPPRQLLDPGVGAGRLLFRAAELGRETKGAPEQLIGLDVDPVSLEMARLNLMMRGVENYGLRQQNFLLDPFPDRPDAVICNPPYSRHHAIAAAEKDAIHAGFEKRLGLRLSRLAGLHVLFLIRALEVTRSGGRLAFITPAEWLDANYGREIKHFVLNRAQVEAIVLWQNDQLLFDGALTTTAITFLSVGAPASGPARVVRLPRILPHAGEVLAAVTGESESLVTTKVHLTEQIKWSRPTQRRGSRGVPLADIASIRRGVATGCNRFFVLSERARHKRGIDHTHLLPCVTTPRLVTGLELATSDLEDLADEVPRWLLNSRDPAAEAANDAVGRYLRWGRRVQKAHRGYLASKRTLWHALEERDECPILFTYMNRGDGRFIRNTAGAVPLNTFLIVEPISGVDSNELWEALLVPHVRRQLRASRRNYGGGLWKIEPRELGHIRIQFQRP